MKNSTNCFDNDTLAIKDVIRHLRVHRCMYMSILGHAHVHFGNLVVHLCLYVCVSL